jgi:site-specific recombinase XerD
VRGLAHLSATSINRHLAMLRSVTKLRRMLGMMSWCLEVPGVKAERRRDVRGPSAEDVKRLLAASSGDSEAETRDRVVLLVFYCLGLRMSEPTTGCHQARSNTFARPAARLHFCRSALAESAQQ